MSRRLFLIALIIAALSGCQGETLNLCVGAFCDAGGQTKKDGGDQDASGIKWDAPELPDLYVVPPDKGIPCPSKVLCGAAGKQVCCASGQMCYGNACVKPGKKCALHSDCPYGYFCDPVFLVCLPKTAAFCQYKPPTQTALKAKVEWTWAKSTIAANHTDALAPPIVVHLTDDNKNGSLGSGDVPEIVFVSYWDDSKNPKNIYLDGIMRALDGATGKELWSITDTKLRMIAGASLAAGDINGDNMPEIVGVDANFYVKAFDRKGKLLWTSNAQVASRGEKTNKWGGWGGGISIADLDADGKPEIFFDRTVFDNTGKLKWKGASGGCGSHYCNYGPLSTAANLDGDAKGTLELVVGNKVYTHDGKKLLWSQSKVTDGYPAVADMFKDGDPDVVLVGRHYVSILDGKTGKVEWGPKLFPYPSGGSASKAGYGGPPTVADFDGDGRPEVGVAGGYYYVVFDPDCKKGASKAVCPSGATDGVLWKQKTKDLSSRATGSSVFDFEGDGKAEAVYSDECFLWVYDGATGKMKYRYSNNTRTATEAPIVADVDGDGRSEIVMVSNRRVWSCEKEAGWVKPTGWSVGKPGYMGITVIGAADDNWVGTRQVWNQHAYHVTNVCDGADQSCATAQNRHAAIPNPEKSNWTLPWLNNFRQNVQGSGLFNAPDLMGGGIKFLLKGCPKKMTVTFTVTNKGSALVGPGLKCTLYFNDPKSGGQALKTVKTTGVLKPNGSETISTEVLLPATYKGQKFELYLQVDDRGDGKGERNECIETNNTSFAKTQCQAPG